MFLDVALVLVSIGGVGHIVPQQVTYSVEESTKAAPTGTSFLAAYGIELNGSWIVEFFRNPDETDQLIAVRSLSTPDGRQDGRRVTTQSCPEIRDVISALSDLPSIDIRVSGFSPWSNLRLPPGPVASGGNYRVWGTARQADGAFANLEASANAGLLAEIVQKMDVHLSNCWSSRGSPPQ